MLKIGITGAGVMGKPPSRYYRCLRRTSCRSSRPVHLPAAQELGSKAGAKIATDDLERVLWG